MAARTPRRPWHRAENREAASLDSTVPDPARWAAQLRELEPDLRGHLCRMHPDVPADAPLRFRPVVVRASHHMCVVETGTEPVRRLFLKGPLKSREPTRESLETEGRVLTEVAPAIAEKNQATRCPQLVAYRPDRELLILEMVEGEHLDSILFGFGRIQARRHLARILGLCGEWLARFHALTQSEEEGNPLEQVLDALGEPPVRDAFDRYAGRHTWEATRDLAEVFYVNYRDFRKPVCLVHRDFTPYHVLIGDGRVYVVDLASSARGYAYEDLAVFTAFYDVRLPWRRAVAAWRMGLRSQREAFLGAYCRATAPLVGVEVATLRLARLIALARLARGLEARDTWLRATRTWLAGFWLRLRFRSVCREELGALERAADLVIARAAR